MDCQVCNIWKFLKLRLKLVSNKTTLFATRAFTVLRVQHFRFQVMGSNTKLRDFKCGRGEFWFENRSISHLFSSPSCTSCYKYLKFIKFKCTSIEGNWQKTPVTQSLATESKFDVQSHPFPAPHTTSTLRISSSFSPTTQIWSFMSWYKLNKKLVMYLNRGKCGWCCIPPAN